MKAVGRPILALMFILGAGSGDAQSAEWSGFASLEPRWFIDRPLLPEQPERGVSPSAVLAPELRLSWNDGDDRITLVPYLRFDADDDRRNHGDVREAVWLHVGGPWVWRAGLGKVFWGVAESRHLVDIVNQTDLVEDIDEEDKLGQPMLSAERWTDRVGTFTAYLLPGFRERTFPAPDSRMRGRFPIDADAATYASNDKDRHIDAALRWSHVIGAWDLGVSGFHGTSREPRLLPVEDAAGSVVLVPRYDLIDQLGVDMQYTRGAWLWKLESILRAGHGERFGALVTGFEYTRFGVGGSSADLGLLLEYLYDGRSVSAPPTAYDDDLFVGIRVSLNDIDDTTLLAGAVLDSSGTVAFVEAQRRFGSRWKLEIEGRFFAGIEESDPLLGGLRKDGFINLRLARYF